jgi:hypothetical protein
MVTVLARNEEMQGRFQSEDEFETSLKMSFHTQYQQLSRRQALNVGTVVEKVEVS